MNQPKVSVLLPVYNGQQYLSKSIDSVLAQDYKDFELLICDDASTDNSVKIIESKKDFRIKFFKNSKNQGLFKNLNILINKSQAEFIRLWSQDDIMKFYCLNEEILFMKKYPAVSFCYCAIDTIDRFGRIIRKAPIDKTPEIISPTLATQIMFYYGSITGNISTVMIRKRVLEELGVFRQDIQLAGDFEMWVRITKKHPVGFIHKPLINLRSHKNQLSRKRSSIVIFTQEEKDIFFELKKRLPIQIRDSALKFHFKKRAILHIRYLISRLLRGQFKIVVEITKINSKRYNIFYSFFIWIITLNGKLFKQKPEFFYEEHEL